MPDAAPTLDYAALHQRRWPAMVRARVAVAVIGVALPYLARVPGMFVHGPEWLTSYFGSRPGTALLIGAAGAINWGAILVCTLAYRTVPAVVVAACVGFALPAYGHSMLHLASDAQAAVGLIGIPIQSLPLVWLGCLMGFWVDDWVCGRRPGV